MSALDDLTLMPGGAGEYARTQVANPPGPFESPEDADARQMDQSLRQERTQRIRGADFAAQGIPAYRDTSGIVQPVADESGAPLTKLDRRNSVAWDALGQPRSVGYDATGAPKLTDPFASVPLTTDRKTGDQYRVTPGLPWKWVGQDSDIAAAGEQRQKDAAISRAASALGGKLSLDQHAALTAEHDLKKAQKEFGALAGRTGLSADSEHGAALTGALDTLDPQAAHAAVDGHFDTLYGALDANATRSLFSNDLSPAAQAIRQGIDSDKAAAHAQVDRMLAFKARADGARAREEATRAQAEQVRQQNVSAKLAAAGVPEDASAAANGAPPVPGLEDVGQTGTAGPTPAREINPEQFNSSGQPAEIRPESATQGIQAAAASGALDPETAAKALPEAQKLEAAHKALVTEAGKHSELKALAEGVTTGGAFLAGGLGGAKLGALAGAAIPGLGETGIPELIGGMIGFLAGGSASVAAKKGIERKLGEYSDAVKSLEASAQLHPNYDAAGNLVSWAIPAGAGVKGLATLGKVAFADAGAGAAVKAISRHLAAGATGGALFEGVVRPAFDAAVNIAKDIAGVDHPQVEAPTMSSLATNIALAALMSGYGIKAKEFSGTQLGDLMHRGALREKAGVKLTNGYLAPSEVPGSEPMTPDEFTAIAQPLTPAEAAAYSKAKAKVAELVKSGEIGDESWGKAIRVQQAQTALGTPLATAADVRVKPIEPGDVAQLPEPEPPPQAPATPAAPADELAHLRGLLAGGTDLDRAAIERRIAELEQPSSATPAHEPSEPQQEPPGTPGAVEPPQPGGAEPAPAGKAGAKGKGARTAVESPVRTVAAPEIPGMTSMGGALERAGVRSPEASGGPPGTAGAAGATPPAAKAGPSPPEGKTPSPASSAAPAGAAGGPGAAAGASPEERKKEGGQTQVSAPARDEFVPSPGYAKKLAGLRHDYAKAAKAATTDQLTKKLNEIGDAPSWPPDGIELMQKQAVEAELSARKSVSQPPETAAEKGEPADATGGAATPARDASKPQRYPIAGELVDGRIVREHIPNMGSIASSLTDYTILPGVREVPMSDFVLTGKHYSVQGDKRIGELADAIASSKELNPLIVVVDADVNGPYILEGATRAEALKRLGAKSMPAKVVVDNGSFDEAFDDNKPVSAAVVDAYGIKLPEGYVKQGELYIHEAKPSEPRAAEPASEPPKKGEDAAPAQALPKAPERAERKPGAALHEAGRFKLQREGTKDQPAESGLTLHLPKGASHIRAVNAKNQVSDEPIDRVLKGSLQRGGPYTKVEPGRMVKGKFESVGKVRVTELAPAPKPGQEAGRAEGRPLPPPQSEPHGAPLHTPRTPHPADAGTKSKLSDREREGIVESSPQHTRQPISTQPATEGGEPKPYEPTETPKEDAARNAGAQRAAETRGPKLPAGNEDVAAAGSGEAAQPAKPRTYTVEEAAGAVERVAARHQPAYDRILTDLQKSETGKDVAFWTAEDGETVHYNPSGVASWMGIVADNGLDPEAWIEACIGDENAEELIHVRQLTYAGPTFIETYRDLWKRLKQPVRDLWAVIYPGARDTNGKPIDYAMAAEFERAVIQWRQMGTITEELSGTDIGRLKPYLRGPQSAAMEENIRRVDSLTADRGEAPPKAEAPAAPAPEPKREPESARGPPAKPVAEPAPVAKPLSKREQAAAKLREKLGGRELAAAKPALGTARPSISDRETRLAAMEYADALMEDGITSPDAFAREVVGAMGWRRPQSLSALWNLAKLSGNDLPEMTEAQWAPHILAAMEDDNQLAQPSKAGQRIEGEPNELSQRERSPETGNGEPASSEAEPADTGDRGRLGGAESETAQGTGGERHAAGAGATGGTGGGAGAAAGSGERGAGAAAESVGTGGRVRRGEPDARLEPGNYVITPADDIGGANPAQKFANNISAISLLKEIESERRDATQAEKKELVQYVGWGGMKNAFNPDKADWKAKHDSLKAMLTPDEYAEAQRSILDSHYTSPDVIGGIYQALERFGFRGGKMVEGGSGIGHFIGLLPEGMRGATSYLGVEKDGITARIAQLLYPKAKIVHGGFENADLVRDSFDASAGNPPFGAQNLFDPKFKEASKFSIHNFFIAKQIELLRPGGVGAWVVSHYFLDAQDPSARKWINERAEFLGAIRLPNTAFKKNAGTEVTTDIVFFQKRQPGAKGADSTWLTVSDTEFGEIGKKLPVINHETLSDGTLGFVLKVGNRVVGEFSHEADAVKAADAIFDTPAPTNGKLNQWMKENPEMMLGEPAMEKAMRGSPEFTLNARQGSDLKADLAAAVKKLPRDIYTQGDLADTERLTAPEATVPDNVKVGSYFADKAGAIQRRGADINTERTSTPAQFPHASQVERVRGMIGVRDALNQLIRAETSDADPKVMKAFRAKLNKVYDAFAEKHGPLNTFTNRRAFQADTDSFRVLALERDFDPGIGREAAKKRGVEPRKAGAGKAAIFKQRVNVGYAEVTSANGPKDALTVSLNQRGMVDLAYMAKLSGMKQADIIKELGDQIFEDPAGDWQQAEQYLSGNVRDKLRVAEAAVAGETPRNSRTITDLGRAWAGYDKENFNEGTAEYSKVESFQTKQEAEEWKKQGEETRGAAQFERNVEALKKVIPADIPPQDIRVPLGAGWVEPRYYGDFARELTGESPSMMAYAPAVAKWNVSMPDSTTAARDTYGTSRMPFGRLLEAVMNTKPVQVFDRNSDGSQTLNTEQTVAAQAKAEVVKEKWADWVMKDQARRTALARKYNDTINNFADTKPNGLHLTLPGKSALVNLYPHQLNGAWRIMTDRTALLDQVVGAGKTFIVSTAVMEMKRLGFARKQMIVVPNHLTTQWRDAIVQLYPNANVLYATAKDFQKKNRQTLFARMMTGEYDAIIIGHSSLIKVGMPAEAEVGLLNEMLNELVDTIRQMRAEERAGRGKSSSDSRFISGLERTKETLQAKLARAMDRTGAKDAGVTFDELGIDGLYVDEAHEFKNLFYTTSMQRVAGLGNPEGSAKAFDLYVKTRWMRTRFGGKAPLVFATGTPVSNSLVEMFTMQRYLQGDRLKTMGLNTLDAWARVFGDVRSVYEVDPSGTGYRLSTRFASFQNVGELSAMYRSVADVVTLDDLRQQAIDRGTVFPVPRVKGGKPENIVVDRSPSQGDYFGHEIPQLNADGGEVLDSDGNPVVNYTPGSLLDRIQNMPDDPSVDNMLKVTNDARKSSLDMRLIHPGEPDFAGSKPNRAVREIKRIYDQWNARKGTQLVFCDLSVPSSARGKATAKARELAAETYVRNLGGHYEIVPDAKPVTLKAAPELSFFVSRAVGKGYSVTERATGLRVGHGSSMAVAIDAAEHSDQLHPGNRKLLEKSIAEHAIPLEEVTRLRDEYERRHGFKKEADDMVDDADELAEEKPGEGVSMDELLADSSKHSVYDDMRDKLIASGVPKEQIAFIHDYETPEQKQKLFDAMNRGDVRILFGSTPKLGAGTNVQRRLVAVTHLDAPWRPSDLEQREGRIIRQGNFFYEEDPEGFEVEILRLATKQTYDTRMWQLIEHKAAGIGQFRSADRTTRDLEDVGGEAANASDMKAAASGDPAIQREIELRGVVKKLTLLQRAWQSSQYQHEANVTWLKGEPGRYESNRIEWDRLNEFAAANPKPDEFSAKVRDKDGRFIPTNERKALSDAFIEAVKTMGIGRDSKGVIFAEYRGLTLRATKTTYSASIYGTAKGVNVELTEFQADDKITETGLVQRMDNTLSTTANERLERLKASLDRAAASLPEEEQLAAQPFEKQDALEAARAEHAAALAAIRTNRRRANTGPQPPDVIAPDKMASAEMVESVDRWQNEGGRALAAAKPEDARRLRALTLLASKRVLRPEEQAEYERLAGTGETDREPDAGPFYSQLTRTIQSLPQETMTVGQARAAIEKGSKQDEIALSGLYTDPLSPLRFAHDPLMRSRDDKVTKTDLLSYALERQAKVQDVVLGSIDIQWHSAKDGNGDEFWEAYRQAGERPILRIENTKGGFGLFDAISNHRIALRESLESAKEAAAKQEATTTHFSQYQLPGADEGSYREMFVTWPQESTERWARRNNYSDEDVRAITEIAAPAKANWKDGHAQFSDIANPIVRIRRNLRTDADGKRTYFIEEIQGPSKTEQEKMPPELRKRIYEIGMKRALRDAVDEWADRLAWTTGEQQAERYDLSKQVDSVAIGRHGNGWQVVARKAGDVAIDRVAGDERELSELVGKELASKAIERGGGTFSGLDLKVGGEGLKRLYDQTLPRIANELAKKFGVKAGTARMKVGEEGSYGGDTALPQFEQKLKALRAAWDGPNRTPEGWRAWNVTLDSQADDVISAMRKGATYGQAMHDFGSEGLAQHFGGEYSIANTMGTIHSLDIPEEWKENAPAFPLLAAKPLARRIHDKAAEAAASLKAEAATWPIKDRIKKGYDATGTLAHLAGEEARNAVRLDFERPATGSETRSDRKARQARVRRDLVAARLVVEAGGERAALLEDQAKIESSPSAALRDEWRPIVKHALENFDDLKGKTAGHEKIANETYDRLIASGEEFGQRENYVHRVTLPPDDPDEISPLFAPGGSQGNNPKGMLKQRAFDKIADAVAAGYDPGTYGIHEADQRMVTNAERIIGSKAFLAEMRTIAAPSDGKPVIGELEERDTPAHRAAMAQWHGDVQDWLDAGKKGPKPRQPRPEMKVPDGYLAVQVMGRPIPVHRFFAPLLKALYGQSALRSNQAGRALMKFIAWAKAYTLVGDTFHIGRMLFKGMASGGGVNVGRGLALIEYAPEDLKRAVANGEIRQRDMDFALKEKPLFQEGLAEGLNIGRIADNLVEQANTHVPGFQWLNDWIFKKLTRSIMAQGFLKFAKRNLAQGQFADRRAAIRAAAKEANEVFGNIQNQGIFQDKTFQDIARAILLAPNWTETQGRAEARAYGQFGKGAWRAIRGGGGQGPPPGEGGEAPNGDDYPERKRFWIGNSARTMAAGLLALFAANQVINYFTRGHSTLQNQEDDHKLDAWLPGGKRGFWFNPFEIAGEYAHAAFKYLAQHENPVDVATHIASNKLSPLARGVKEAATGRDYAGRHFLSNTDRFRAAAADALPSPIPFNALLERDPRQPLGYRVTRQPGALEKQLLQSSGAKVTAAQSPRTQMFMLAQPFRADRGKTDTAGEYTELRRALDNDNFSAARSEVQWLQERGKTLDRIKAAVGFRKDGSVAPELFAGGREREAEFVQSLSPAHRELYGQAQRDHAENAQKLLRVLSTAAPVPEKRSAFARL